MLREKEANKRKRETEDKKKKDIEFAKINEKYSQTFTIKNLNI